MQNINIPKNFHSPVKIFFSPLEESIKDSLPNIMQRKILIITSNGMTQRGKINYLTQLLSNKQVDVFDQVSPNPSLEEMQQALTKLSEGNYDLIIAFGGGSVIDFSKVIRVGLSRTVYSISEMLELENIEKQDNLMLVAIPTTAGTGSEVTPFSTIWDKSNKIKLSLQGEGVLPEVAIVDGSQMLSLDYEGTLFPAMDAISHALESLWNVNSNEISRSLAYKALDIISENLMNVLLNPNNSDARNDMALASTLSGLSISLTKTAIAHSISYPLTSHFNVPHGLACSFSLPYLIEMNKDILIKNEEDQRIIDSIKEIFDKVDLKGFLVKYLSVNELLQLKGEMFHPQRIRNYSGKVVSDLDELLISSIE